MRQVELLIKARWVAPVSGALAGPKGDVVLERHALAVDAGRIVALLPWEEADASFSADLIIERPEHLLIPGLINAHTHAAMTLLRGYADDLPLMTWLEGHIWPAEARWVSDGFVYDGSRLACAEMLLSGTTCFNDMYFFPDAVARAAAAAGLRARVGLVVLEFATAWAADAAAYIHRGLEVHDGFRDHPLIGTAFAPHAPYTVGDDALRRIRELASELDIPIHMHLHETADEIQQVIDTGGRRPIQRLDALGLLGPDLIGVHLTQIDDDELALLARNNVRAVHCPESNLKLASGAAPVAAMLDAGIPVALGTDGASSNNDLDMLGEMHSAALLGKWVAGDASALPAHTVLRMATLNGATAMGLADQVGSLEPGRWADLVCVDLHRVATRPCFDPVAQLVYAASREQVSDTWVAGEHLVAEGELTRQDLDALIADADAWGERIEHEHVQADQKAR
jgi:5-methylthioadenosine/S-adenosylhomocysteine deaminase